MSSFAELLVADSFRVRVHPRSGAAQVRGWRHHLDRFTAAVGDAVWGTVHGEAPDRPQRAQAPVRTAEATARLLAEHGVGLDRFVADLPAPMAAYGQSFPRLELWHSDEYGFSLDLALRPLPQLGETLEMRTARDVELLHPERKGPNIATFGMLNQELGAEALIVDERGIAVEGATTSVMWWSSPAAAPQVLYVSDTAARVRSVAEQLVTRIARDAGIEVKRASITPVDLVRHEVWAVNALHGIRPALRIDGAETRPADPRRLAKFRISFEETWESVAP